MKAVQTKPQSQDPELKLIKKPSLKPHDLHHKRRMTQIIEQRNQQMKENQNLQIPFQPQIVNPLKQAFMTRKDGQRNYDALQNTQLTPEIEAGLLNAINVRPCPLYTFNDIVMQEKAYCNYKFTEDLKQSFAPPFKSFATSVSWITIEKDTGKFNSNNSACSHVVNKLLSKFRGGSDSQLTEAERRRMRTEGNLDKQIASALKRLATQTSPKRLQELSLLVTQLDRENEQKQRMRGDSQIEIEIEKEMKMNKQHEKGIQKAIEEADAAAKKNQEIRRFLDGLEQRVKDRRQHTLSTDNYFDSEKKLSGFHTQQKKQQQDEYRQHFNRLQLFLQFYKEKLMLKKTWHSTVGEHVVTAEEIREKRDAFTDQFNLDFNELFRVYRQNEKKVSIQDIIATRPSTKSYSISENRPQSKRGRMMEYANALAKRPERDLIENRSRSQVHVKRPASSYCIEIKQKQADYLKDVEPGTRLLKQISNQTRSYANNLMAANADRDLEGLLKQEVKDLKAKYYGKLDQTGPRRKGTLHEDLVEFIYGTQPMENIHGFMTNQSVSNVQSHIELQKKKPKSVLRSSVNFDSKLAKSAKFSI